MSKRVVGKFNLFSFQLGNDCLTRSCIVKNLELDFHISKCEKLV